MMPKLGFKKTVTSAVDGAAPGDVFFSGMAGVLIRSPERDSWWNKDARRW
ncbi:hypothetical protein [Myxococcus sp. Y35]